MIKCLFTMEVNKEHPNEGKQDYLFRVCCSEEISQHYLHLGDSQRSGKLYVHKGEGSGVPW